MTLVDNTADAEPDERIDAARAAAIQGLPLSSFNAARRSMQLVRDRATGRLLPYPDFSRDTLGNAASPEERRRRRSISMPLTCSWCLNGEESGTPRARGRIRYG